MPTPIDDFLPPSCSGADARALRLINHPPPPVDGRVISLVKDTMLAGVTLRTQERRLLARACDRDKCMARWLHRE